MIVGFSEMLLSLISIARDGNWSASRPIIYGTFVAVVATHGLIAIFLSRIMPKIQSGMFPIFPFLVTLTNYT